MFWKHKNEHNRQKFAKKHNGQILEHDRHKPNQYRKASLSLVYVLAIVHPYLWCITAFRHSLFAGWHVYYST